MSKLIIIIMAALMALVVAAVNGAIIGTVIWLVWNWLVPQVFSGPALSWLQAVAFAFMVRVLWPVTISDK